jgi:hypothetical protein
MRLLVLSSPSHPKYQVANPFSVPLNYARLSSEYQCYQCLMRMSALMIYLYPC